MSARREYTEAERGALVEGKHSASPLSQRPSDSRDTGREQGLAYAAGFQFQGRSSWTVVPGSFTRTMTSAR